MTGDFRGVNSPSITCKSVRHTPQARTRTSTSPLLGFGSGTSVNWSGFVSIRAGALNKHAFIRASHFRFAFPVQAARWSLFLSFNNELSIQLESNTANLPAAGPTIDTISSCRIIPVFDKLVCFLRYNHAHSNCSLLCCHLFCTGVPLPGRTSSRIERGRGRFGSLFNVVLEDRQRIFQPG